VVGVVVTVVVVGVVVTVVEVGVVVTVVVSQSVLSSTSIPANDEHEPSSNWLWWSVLDASIPSTPVSALLPTPTAHRDTATLL
jgi:hypothetical protein